MYKLNLLFFSIIIFNLNLSFANTCKSYLIVQADLQDLANLNPIPIKVDGTIADSITSKPAFDFVGKYKGQWLILDLSALACPYCSLDHLFFSQQRNSNGDYTSVPKLWQDKVKMISFYYEISGKGAWDQNFDLVRNFILPENISQHDYLKEANLEGIDIFYIPRAADAGRLSQTVLTRTGELLFGSMSGMPYQLIFNPDGQLVYAGNFTMAKEGEDWSAPYQRHYQMINNLINP